MLISLDKSLPNPTLRDTAYKRQLELFEKVKVKGISPLVIDSKELLTNRKYVLPILCDRLNIPFEDAMLNWEPGPIPEDGVWAKHWYENVHRSTGFKPHQPKEDNFPEHLIELYNTCKPIYNKLFAHAIKITQK